MEGWNMKVLVADDDSTSRRVLLSVLTKWGYETVSAEDGEQALRIMGEPDAPRLALVDWMMPKMDGLEVCRNLRARDDDQPVYVIIVTSRSEKHHVVQALVSGADDYISKPFDTSELEARVGVGKRVVELQQRMVTHVRQLHEALDHVRKLQGLLPICMHCHKIRNESQLWQNIDHYISEHTDAEFSHGICPDCLRRYYPEVPEELPCQAIA